MSTSIYKWNEETVLRIAHQALKELGITNYTLDLLRIRSNAVLKCSTPSEDLILKIQAQGNNIEDSIRVIEWMSSHGYSVLAPVVPLHYVDNHIVTLWPYIEERKDVPLDFIALGTLIRELHNNSPQLSKIAGYSTLSPHLAMINKLKNTAKKIQTAAANNLLSQQDLELVASVYNNLEQALLIAHWKDEKVVHGDLYPSNVLVSETGQYLIDFDWMSPGASIWDHIPILAQARFWGTPISNYDNFALGYGQDIRNDEFVEDLIQLRGFSTAMSSIILASTLPQLAQYAINRLKYWKCGYIDEYWIIR